MTRLPVQKTYKLYIGGAFPRSESGRTYEAEGRNVARASRKDARYLPDHHCNAAPANGHYVLFVFDRSDIARSDVKCPALVNHFGYLARNRRASRSAARKVGGRDARRLRTGRPFSGYRSPYSATTVGPRNVCVGEPGATATPTS